jgi:hypothetical protein
MENSTEHSMHEILKRITRELKLNSVEAQTKPYMQFRLVYVSRQDTHLKKDIMFISQPYRYNES